MDGDPIARLPGYLAGAPRVIEAADQGVHAVGLLVLFLIGATIIHLFRTRRDP